MKYENKSFYSRILPDLTFDQRDLDNEFPFQLVPDSQTPIITTLSKSLSFYWPTIHHFRVLSLRACLDTEVSELLTRRWRDIARPLAQRAILVSKSSVLAAARSNDYSRSKKTIINNLPLLRDHDLVLGFFFSALGYRLMKRLIEILLTAQPDADEGLIDLSKECSWKFQFY